MLSVTQLHTEYTSDKGQKVKAAQDISFDVPEGKLFTLLGPSGCGKTTTLRSIAGLERPTSGQISVGGVAVYSSAKNLFVAPNQRNFGMVFQSYAIWPHMNVFENAAFPLRVGRSRVTNKEIEERVMRVLTAVGLDQYASREATRMSGGQQQRLALARALVMKPKLLLLDEPLSNLDAKLRERMRFELKRIQRELNITTIYVTHDQSEALALSHEIAVLNEGRIVQIGSARDIYERPRSKFVADFVGLTNFVDGTVRSEPGQDALVESELGKLAVAHADGYRANDPILLSIRPEDVQMSLSRPDGEKNIFEGRVEVKVFLGEYMDYQIRIGTRQVLARVHPSLDAAIGDTVYIKLNPEKCIPVQAGDALRKAA
jgi:iron(III) transport system ATP-binding protein